MECEEVCYPCVRKEVTGSYGEVKFSLVDIRDGEVVASWMERDEGAVWGEDCYSVDENEYNSEPVEEGRKIDPLSVYVGNLDPSATKEDLVRHFSVVGEIFQVTLLRSKKREVRTGSAFIRFSGQGAAERALFLDRSCLRGTLMIVRGKLVRDAGELNKDGDVDPLSIYIGNLDHSVSSLDLASHFHEVGELDKVTVLRNKETGEHKGLMIVRGKLVRDAGELNKDGDVDPLSIYIGNLDHSVSSLDLASHFHEVGELDKVTVLRNKETGEHKGAAYVQFKDQGGLERALSLDGCYIAGKNIRVKRKRKTTSAKDANNNNKRARKDSDEEEASSAHDPSSVYVGNIDVGTSRSDLEEHFQSTGDIVRVSILKSNNAAYIQFKDSWSVEGALCMDGRMLRGKEIKVRRKKLKST